MLTVIDGGIHENSEMHNSLVLPGTDQFCIRHKRIRRRPGANGSISVAVVAWIALALVLVDLPAHVFCLDDRDVHSHDEERGHGLHVA